MSLIPGLQDYHLSDSEGETSPSRLSLSAPGIVSSGLGIPRRKSSHTDSPPPFVKPKVQSAPSISLVGYDDEDKDGGDASYIEEEDEGDITISDSLHHLLPPPSLITLINRHSPAQSNEQSPSVDRSSSPKRSPTPESPTTTGAPSFLPLDGIELPPEPPEVCSEELQAKIVSYLEKKEKYGITPYDVITKNKSFRNPSLYRKLIELCDLDEYGTNYPKKMFDPYEWKPEDYYDKLAVAQKKAHEKAQIERSKIEFKSGSKLPPPTTGGGGLLPTPTQDVSKKRKSKWDAPSSASKRITPDKTVNPSAVGAQALVNARLIDKNLIKLFKS